MLRTHITRLAARLLGSPPVAHLARLANRGRLPVLAYHDVRDAAIFSRHLDLIQDHYHPVSGAEIAAAVRSGAHLPRSAIWITFDDANPGVFAHAMPLLKQRGIPATLFACPGVVDTDQPYWWQVLDLALANRHVIVHGGTTWSDSSIVTHLKSIPDDSRRRTVARVADEIADAGVSVSVPQATSGDLLQWIEAGLDVGNHSWDHPCLDRCDTEQQRRQIVAADDWLRDLLGIQPRLFAYPNGNVAGFSRAVLAERGYIVTALFDHRLAHLHGPEVSRLRIDADAPLKRLAAIASGAHPTAYALLERARRVRTSPGGPN